MRSCRERPRIRTAGQGFVLTRDDDRMMRFDEFGPNSGFVEELYRRYLDAPTSVDAHWRAYFAAQEAAEGANLEGSESQAAADASAVAWSSTGASPLAGAAESAPQRDARTTPKAVPSPLQLEGDEPEPLRGSAARAVENMEASLTVPTATSVRTVPAKLLEVNREILNNELERTGVGKVSFTHLIAFAVVRALHEFPNLNATYDVRDGAPSVVRHRQLNLGLAVDVIRRDGSHSLLVPCVKAAEMMDFAIALASDDMSRAPRLPRMVARSHQQLQLNGKRRRRPRRVHASTSGPHVAFQFVPEVS